MAVRSKASVSFAWGADGVERLAATSHVVVIVDVLSFSTAVDVAVSAGARVYPCQDADESTAAIARQVGAALATDRQTATRQGGLSLSPVSMRGLQAAQSRLGAMILYIGGTVNKRVGRQ